MSETSTDAKRSLDGFQKEVNDAGKKSDTASNKVDQMKQFNKKVAKRIKVLTDKV